MTNMDRIRESTAEEMAGKLCTWIVRCSRSCPALAYCRGQGCHRGLLTWLKAEEDHDERQPG